MARTKKQSSVVARIRDLVNNLTGELDVLQSEMDDLLADSEWRKETEPTLSRLLAAFKPTIPDPKPTEESTSPAPDETTSLETTGTTSPDPVKRAKHIRKKLSETPPEENKLEVGQ